MWALFESESDAVAHDAAISAAQGWPDDGTVRYAAPRRTADGRWAMPVDAGGVVTRAMIPPGVAIVDVVDWPEGSRDA